MKKTITALILLAPLAGFSVDSPLDFSTAKIQGPTVSLTANALQNVPSLVPDFRPIARVVVVSKMPILTPSTEIDPKMVKAPDSSVDYALIVKAPDLQPEAR